MSNWMVETTHTPNNDKPPFAQREEHNDEEWARRFADAHRRSWPGSTVKIYKKDWVLVDVLMGDERS